MGPQVVLLLAGTGLGLLTQMAAGLLGPFGFLLGLLAPLPVGYAGLRQGWPVAAGIVLLTAAGLSWIFGPAGALAYLLQYGFPAWLLALLLGRGWSWDRAVAGTVVSFAAVAGAALTVFNRLREEGISITVHRYLQSEVERAMAFWRAADLPAEQLAELQEVSRQMADFLMHAWPGLVVTAAGALLLSLVLILSAVARGRYRIAGPSFRQWKASEFLIWALILAGAGMLLADGVIRRLALNVLVVVLPVYFLQGMAIVSFWFQKKSISPLLRNLGYLFILIVNPLPVVVTGLGVFDMWVDFRRPRVKKT
jgi:uncharacterized protein YybS (DUF2232 family)